MPYLQSACIFLIQGLLGNAIRYLIPMFEHTFNSNDNWFRFLFQIVQKSSKLHLIHFFFAFEFIVKSWKRRNGNCTNSEKASFKWQLYIMLGIFLSEWERKWINKNIRIYRISVIRTQTLNAIYASPSSNGVFFSFSISMNFANMWIIACTVYSLHCIRNTHREQTIHHRAHTKYTISQWI